jgi:glycerol-3-phosphate acyltransferase PlsY
VDISKGIAAILLSRALECSLGWQLAAGAFVVLGHDFSLFAGLRGGQGFATTLGVLVALVPAEALPGLTVYGLLYWITRKSDLSVGVGMGLLAAPVWFWEDSIVLLLYVVMLFLSIPAQKLLDTPRRRHVTSHPA